MGCLPPEPASCRGPSNNSSNTTIAPFPRDAIINDLRQYLITIRSKVDEAGEPTVVFPINYEDVVSYMGRSDITSPDADRCQGDNNHENKKPWTHYLLEEGIAKSGQGTFAAYREDDGDVSMESRVLRGLAKIKYVIQFIRYKGHLASCDNNTLPPHVLLNAGSWTGI